LLEEQLSTQNFPFHFWVTPFWQSACRHHLAASVSLSYPTYWFEASLLIADRYQSYRAAELLPFCGAPREVLFMSSEEKVENATCNSGNPGTFDFGRSLDQKMPRDTRSKSSFIEISDFRADYIKCKRKKSQEIGRAHV
jgi:hypothetical protein